MVPLHKGKDAKLVNFGQPLPSYVQAVALKPTLEFKAPPPPTPQGVKESRDFSYEDDLPLESPIIQKLKKAKGVNSREISWHSRSPPRENQVHHMDKQHHNSPSNKGQKSFVKNSFHTLSNLELDVDAHGGMLLDIPQ